MAVSLAAIAPVLFSGSDAGASPEGTSRHVLPISVDDLHASDLAQCEANRECPNLAARAGVGTTYTNAKTSEPSDSASGLMALVTGGDPKLTGVYYDDSYSRDMYTPPAQTPRGTQDCSGPAGAETGFENVDNLARSLLGDRMTALQVLGRDGASDGFLLFTSPAPGSVQPRAASAPADPSPELG